MNKNTYEKITLTKGEMNVYNFGAVKLHAYKTNDFIDDEVFIIEKNGNAVLIESPCFFDNNRELEAYLAENSLNVSGMLLAYHMAGASFLPGVRKYATKNADEYAHTGGGNALIGSFTGTFGAIFDGAVHTVTDYLTEGPITIGGIEFNITLTPDAFDVEIPEINTVYTHMLGHDCHSIVAGVQHAEAMEKQLEGYLEKGYMLVLTSHYTPEDLKDVEAKLAYLKRVKEIGAASGSAEEFKTAVKKEYPNYGGDNYLDMTAGFFFD